MQETIYYQQFSSTEAVYILKNALFKHIGMTLQECMQSKRLFRFLHEHLREEQRSDGEEEFEKQMAVGVGTSNIGAMLYVKLFIDEIDEASLNAGFEHFLNMQRIGAGRYSDITDSFERIWEYVERDCDWDDELIDGEKSEAGENQAMMEAPQYPEESTTTNPDIHDRIRSLNGANEQIGDMGEYKFEEPTKTKEVWFFQFKSLEHIAMCYDHELAKNPNRVYYGPDKTYVLEIEFEGTVLDGYLKKGLLLEFGQVQKYKYYEGELLIRENALNILHN